jgi:hypothetical protein
VYVDPRKPTTIIGDYSFDGEPFYVGKGKGKRAWAHLQESAARNHNSLKFNKIKRIIDSGHDPIICFIKTELSENDAHGLERTLIALIGTKWTISGVPRGPLCNMTSGGEGCVRADELKQKYAHYGEENGMYGKNHTQQTKDKISEFRKSFRHSEDTKQQMKEGRSGMNAHGLKQWKLLTPDGNVILVDHLRIWCCERGLNYNTIFNTLKKETPVMRGPARGYKLVCAVE